MVIEISKTRAILLAVLAVVTSVVGCDKPPAGPPPTPPPPSVTVSKPLQREVIEWDVFEGYLEAPEVSNISARVSGLIVEMPFAEGQVVKKGDLLAVIDDAPYKADLNAKLADVQKAEANLVNTKATYDRYKGIAINSVSRQEVDNALAAYNSGVADVASAKASVDLSQLNLGWTRVTAPINGRVSSKHVTVGNQVIGGGSMSQGTQITTIQKIDPIYCYVDIDEASVLKYQRLAADRQLANAREGKVPCFAQLGNEKGFNHKGTIDFVDNHIDTGTGTQRVRGMLENADERLQPGNFARLTLPGSGRYTAMLIPDAAIGTDQDQRIVLIVGAEKKVEPRPVKLGMLFGSLRVVTSGLKPDDEVIINGAVGGIRARPGSVVDPKTGEIKADPAWFPDPGTGVAMPTTSPTGTSAATTLPMGDNHP